MTDIPTVPEYNAIPTAFSQVVFSPPFTMACIVASYMRPNICGRPITGTVPQ